VANPSMVFVGEFPGDDPAPKNVEEGATVLDCIVLAGLVTEDENGKAKEVKLNGEVISDLDVEVSDGDRIVLFRSMKSSL